MTGVFFMPESSDALISMRDYARRHNVSYNTLYSRSCNGHLPYSRLRGGRLAIAADTDPEQFRKPLTRMIDDFGAEWISLRTYARLNDLSSDAVYHHVVKGKAVPIKRNKYNHVFIPSNTHPSTFTRPRRRHLPTD